MTNFKRLNDLYKKINWEKYYTSAAIDLLALITTTDRQAIRVPFRTKDNASVKKFLIDWADGECYYSGYDESYVVISKNDNVHVIIETDRSPDIHTKKFGTLLGYPSCCSEWAEGIGESMLDKYEQEILVKRNYIGIWKLIDHKLYTEGKSLISHIPCSNYCGNSLQVAKQTLHTLNQYQQDNDIREWHFPEKQWLFRIMLHTKY